MLYAIHLFFVLSFSHEITHCSDRRHCLRSKQYCPLNRLLPYATAIIFQARFARGFFVLSFAARKKGPKKVLIILRYKIFPQNRERFIKRNGIVTSFALFLLRQLLEMWHRLTRFTCTSQNPAIAPQAMYGLLTYTVLKALG